MHTRPDPAFDDGWLAGEGLPREHGRDLLRLLAALARSSSLRERRAPRDVLPLRLGPDRRRGARASAGRWSTWAAGAARGSPSSAAACSRRTSACASALDPEFERLRGELRGMLAGASPPAAAACGVHASHDLALGELARVCAPQLDLEIVIRGADDSLAALARGRMRARGIPCRRRPAARRGRAAALGRWLDPRKHQLVHFVTREQGLIVRPRLAHPRRQRPGAARRALCRQARRRPATAPATPTCGSPRRSPPAAPTRASGCAPRQRACACDFVPLATERYFLAAARRTLRGPASACARYAVRVASRRRLPATMPRGQDDPHAVDRRSIPCIGSQAGAAASLLGSFPRLALAQQLPFDPRPRGGARSKSLRASRFSSRPVHRACGCRCRRWRATTRRSSAIPGRATVLRGS